MNIYKPSKTFKRHPVLQREIKTHHISRELLDFPLFRRPWIIGIVTLHVILGLVVFGTIFSYWLSTPPTQPAFDWQLLPIVLIVVHIGSSLLADILAISRTVYWWHATQRQEQLDILRTTQPDDRDLLRIFTAVNSLRSWGPLQFDVALRMVVTIIALCVTYFYTVEGLASRTAWLRFGLYASIAVFAAVGGLMYARNPARRLQSTVLFSTWSALRIKEPIVAILVTLGCCLLLRMIIATVFTVVVYQSMLMLISPTMRSIFDPANTEILARYYLWFIGLTLLFWLGSRYFYAALNSVFEKRALAALRSGS